MATIPQKDFSQLKLDKDIINMDNLQQNQNTGNSDDDDSEVEIIDEISANQNEIPVYCIDQENENKEGDLRVKLIAEGKYLVVFENRRIEFQVPPTFFGFICSECHSKSLNMFSMMRHIFISHFDGEGKQMPNYTVDSERDEQFDYQEEEVKQTPEIEQEIDQQSETESSSTGTDLPDEEEEEQEEEAREEAFVDAPLIVDSSFDMSLGPNSQENPPVPSYSSTPSSSSSSAASSSVVNHNNDNTSQNQNQNCHKQNLPKLENCGDGLYCYGNSFFLYTYEYVCVECRNIVSIRDIVAHSETCFPGQQTFGFEENDYNEELTDNLVPTTDGVPEGNSKTIHSLSFD